MWALFQCFRNSGWYKYFVFLKNQFPLIVSPYSHLPWHSPPPRPHLGSPSSPFAHYAQGVEVYKSNYSLRCELEDQLHKFVEECDYLQVRKKGRRRWKGREGREDLRKYSISYYLYFAPLHSPLTTPSPHTLQRVH